jgi:ParB-like nuclease domain/DNA methylase
MLLQPSPVLPPLPPEEYEALRDHIACHGVQQPILVTSSGIIIDGNHVYRAVTELGLRKYPIRVVGNLSEMERREMAISLNLLRRHLTRTERQHWLEELIRLNPHQSSRDLAAAAKVSQSTAARAKAKVLGTESNDSVEVIGANGKRYKYKPAVSVENPQSAKKAGLLLESLGDRAPEGGVSMRKLRRTRWDQERDERLAAVKPVSIKDFDAFNCDFRRAGDRIKTGSVDVAIVDPPWADWETLGHPLGKELQRILRPNGIACVYPGCVYEDQWNDALKSTGLEKEWKVIALRRVISGTLVVNKPVMSRYTPILLYRNRPTGVFTTPAMLSDVIESKHIEKEWDDWQQPVGEAVHLLRSLSKPGDLIADLCVGTGTVAVASAQVGGGRRFVGCDIDEKKTHIAMSRVAEVLRLTAVPVRKRGSTPDRTLCPRQNTPCEHPPAPET